MKTMHRFLLAVFLLVTTSFSVSGADFSKFKGLYKPVLSSGVMITGDLLYLDLVNKENNLYFQVYYDKFIINIKNSGTVTATAKANYADPSGYPTSATFTVKFKGKLTSLKTLTQYIQRPQTAKFKMTGDDGSIVTGNAAVWPTTKATELQLDIERKNPWYFGRGNFSRYKR